MKVCWSLQCTCNTTWYGYYGHFTHTKVYIQCANNNTHYVYIGMNHVTVTYILYYMCTKCMYKQQSDLRPREESRGLESVASSKEQWQPTTTHWPLEASQASFDSRSGCVCVCVCVCVWVSKRAVNVGVSSTCTVMYTDNGKTSLFIIHEVVSQKSSRL